MNLRESINKLLSEIKISKPNIFIDPYKESINTDIINDLGYWIGGENSLGFEVGYDWTEIEDVYEWMKDGYIEADQDIHYNFNSFKLLLNNYNNKVFILPDEGEINFKYLVIKDQTLIGVDQYSSRNNAIQNENSIEEQMKLDCMFYLKGIKNSKNHPKKELINIQDTNYNLYKFEVKGKETYFRNEKESGKSLFNRIYFFLLPKEEHISESDIITKVNFWGADPYFVNTIYNGYKESTGNFGNGDKSKTIFETTSKHLKEINHIPIPKNIYNILLDRYTNKHSKIEPLRYDVTSNAGLDVSKELYNITK